MSTNTNPGHKSHIIVTYEILSDPQKNIGPHVMTINTNMKNMVRVVRKRSSKEEVVEEEEVTRMISMMLALIISVMINHDDVSNHQYYNFLS